MQNDEPFVKPIPSMQNIVIVNSVSFGFIITLPFLIKSLSITFVIVVGV